MKKFLFFIFFFALEAEALTFSGSVGDAKLWLDENIPTLLEECNPEQLVDQTGVSLERASFFCEKVKSKYNNLSIKNIECPKASIWFSDEKKDKGYTCDVLLATQTEKIKASFGVALDDNAFKYKFFDIPIDSDAETNEKNVSWIREFVREASSDECKKNLTKKVFKYPKMTDSEYGKMIEFYCEYLFQKENCQIGYIISNYPTVLNFDDNYESLLETTKYDVGLFCNQKRDIVLKIIHTTDGPMMGNITIIQEENK